MLIFIVYILGILESLNAAIVVTTVVVGFVFGLRLIFNSLGVEDTEIFIKKTCYIVWLFPCMLVVSVFTPTKNTAYNMLAAYGVTEAYQYVSESKEAKGIASKSLAVLDKAMNDYLTTKK